MTRLRRWLTLLVVRSLWAAADAVDLLRAGLWAIIDVLETVRDGLVILAAKVAAP